jgi:hypothetical protein
MGLRWEDDRKMDLKEGVDWIIWLGPVDGSCEHCNELLGFRLSSSGL